MMGNRKVATEAYLVFGLSTDLCGEYHLTCSWVLSTETLLVEVLQRGIDL